MRIRVIALSACLVLAAAVASAQTRPPQQGPLVLQPTNDGPVFSPEVKFAQLHASDGILIGGYGGWLVDDRVLFGAGADFLVDHGYHDPVAGMGYGGFVTGYLLPASPAFHAGVRALIGFGEASFNDVFGVPVSVFPHPHHDGVQSPPVGTTVTQLVHFHDGFFIFEPQGTAVVRFSRAVALDVAAGYRVISGTGFYNSWIRGFSGTVGIRFGPGI